MVVSVIQSRVSATDLALKPGLSTATFEVEVVNGSDRPASFHVVLSATGDEGQAPRRWYRLSPMASSKVPPGAHSVYTVIISDTPLAGFVGLANLTVRIISPELQSEERHILRLRVEPSLGAISFEAELPSQYFQNYPGQLVDIPARIYNRNRNPISVTLSFPGIDAWLLDNSLKTLRLLPNRWRDIVISCQIPEDLSLGRSQTYPFQFIVADENGDSAIASGVLEVLPLGYFEVVAAESLLRLPAARQWLPNRHANATQTQFRLENHSNFTDTLHIAARSPQSAAADTSGYQINFEPAAAVVEPGQVHTVDATIYAERPWLGWVRTLWITFHTRLEEAPLELRNDTETLQVQVAPIIPRWLQLLAMLLLAGAIAGLGFFHVYRQHHRQLVSSVAFNGVGTRVVSGSNDQTIRQWRVRRLGLRPAGSIIQLDKAVRAAQYRPVDNNQLIVALENGEIQIWDLLASLHQPLQTLVNQTGSQADLADRVMALTPTLDSRYLFSGYGSGEVAQWDISPHSTVRTGEAQRPIQTVFIPEMSIYDIALVGGDDAVLAIAGRYNKLLLWKWSEAIAASPSTSPPDEQNTAAVTDLTSIEYPLGGQDDYITSLATAEQTPFRLAAADNQGRIMVWDLENCLDDSGPCTVIDQWQVPGAAIRDIAFSASGCYLVSASDAGQVTLWPLTNQGRRLTKYLVGQTIQETKTRFNSVDIKVTASKLLIVSGADNNKVRLHRLEPPTQACQR